MTAFPVTERTRLRRAPKRGAYDRETVYAILDAAPFCHVGLVDEGRPVVIPVTHWRDGDRLYIHGSKAGRRHQIMAGGADICVTVSLFDGWVMTRSAFHHSANYRSVVVFGRAVEIVSPEEKTAAFKVLIEHIAPGRWAEVRPPSLKELNATSVLAIPLEEASAKMRTGGPNDDPDDMSLPVWAGVVPYRLVPGAPEPDPQSAGRPVPDYLAVESRRG